MRIRNPGQRFAEKVSVNKDTGCWDWLGSIRPDGYGAFYSHSGALTGAHRFAYEEYRGAIPDGVYVLHHCDNRRCVNPGHLFLGSHNDNMRDMSAKGRVSHGAPHSLITRGEHNGRSKLDEGKVREMRRLSATGIGAVELARRFEVSSAVASKAIRGRTWSHVR